MTIDLFGLPDDYPDELKHSDEDTPVPTWAQVTHSWESPDQEMIAHVARIVADTADEETAREAWASWPENYRRSVGLLIDKIHNEGWIDAVGHIDGWPWDGGFFFWPRETEAGALADVLTAKAGKRGVYIESLIENGLFAFLNSWNHKAWVRSWMETDAGAAALHVGVFADGRFEAHLEVYNPLFIKGAPRRDLIRIPFVGAYNHKQFLLHRRWEQSEFAGLTRTSANFYHLMRDHVPLSF
jgi:hypothetical protein